MAIIQHTRDHTTLGDLAVGERIDHEAMRDKAGFTWFRFHHLRTRLHHLRTIRHPDRIAKVG